MLQMAERDQQILQTLVFKARLISLEQLVATWWAGAHSAARRRLAELVEANHLVCQSVLACPLLTLEAPVASWAPGQPGPDSWAVSEALQRRWREPARSTRVYIASRKTAARYGGAGGRHKHGLQATHDLHLTQVYLNLLRDDPTLAAAWVGEDHCPSPEFREKLPDALIRDATGRTRLVIEFGGRYDADRVQDFHQHCALQELPYELW